MKQAESAQNKRTANEDESFKLGMACSSIGPVFSTTNVGNKSNIVVFSQREFDNVTKPAKRSFQPQWFDLV